MINLAGEPIVGSRWTESRKRRITQSRIDATRAIVEALRPHAAGSRTLINASGIGYYGPSKGISIYETVGAGDGFLADLCVKWEGEARRAEDFGVRVVRLRDGSRERWRCVGQDGLAISPVSRWTDHGGYSMGHMDPSPGHHRLGAMDT